MHAELHAETPDNAAPEEVAVNALTQIFTWQPAIERGRLDALKRAEPWLAGELLNTARGDHAEGLRPDQDWERWAGNNEIVSATATVDMVRSATENEVVLALTITQRVMGPLGVSAQQTFPATATVSKLNQGWRLISYTS